MTVKELIEELKKHDESKRVTISCFDSEGIYFDFEIGDIINDVNLNITLGGKIHEQ